MIYTIRHVTRYVYDTAIRESVMEVRKQPLTNGHQRCINFHLDLSPEARVYKYQDYLGNTVHHFDIPWPHQELKLIGQAVVEVKPEPDTGTSGSWEELETLVASADYYDMLMPSHFVKPCSQLDTLAKELKVERRGEPYALLCEVTGELHKRFQYDRDHTKVDSPIEVALESRRGAAQDFTHVLLGLFRLLEVPSRYVSGYLFRNDQDAPGESSHAWVEALLPGRGWLGFDPTNNMLAGERHIRTCIGRDYADVPPTRGVYKGHAASELSFAVQVHLPEENMDEDRFQKLR